MKALAAILALLPALPACSLLTVRGPATTEPDAYPQCDPSPSAVIGDALVAVGFLVATAVLIVDEDIDEDDRDYGYATGIAGVAFGSSAIRGLVVGHRCESARNRWAANSVIDDPYVAPAAPPDAGGLGQRCYPNRTCDADLYCHPVDRVCGSEPIGHDGGPCTSDGTCRPDLECVRGRCRTPGQVECRAHEHCPTGTWCQAGACVTAPPAGDTNGPPTGEPPADPAP